MLRQIQQLVVFVLDDSSLRGDKLALGRGHVRIKGVVKGRLPILLDSDAHFRRVGGDRALKREIEVRGQRQPPLRLWRSPGSLR